MGAHLAVDYIAFDDTISPNSAGQPGNEQGFIVQIKADDVEPPYVIQPGTVVRLVAEYDSREDRLGICFVH